MDDLTKEFLAESQEGLDRMERCLTELETRPGDRQLIDEIFRAVHTIKGTTGFLGFSRLEALAHAGENLLGALRCGRISVTADLISGLLGLLDGLRSILRLIATTAGEGQRATDEDYDLIGRMLALQCGDPFSQAPAIHPSQTVPDPLAPQPAHTPELRHDAADDELQLHQLHAADEAERRIVCQAPDVTLRVDIDILNRIMNLAGELVLTRNQILGTAGWAQDHPELARRLDAITSELRSAAMDARMQPVSHVFGKFPRMVRDLAHLCGRQVRLEFEGQNNELDKTLLEAVRDPLTHAIRNAVDHGIEAPEDRIRAGKNPEGVIRLRAYSQNGVVVIEVSDDGAGIAPERVLARAIERDMIAADAAAHMTSAEVMQLLFEPGFSTADSVTSVSGRGVGLDVVRANVERVGGTVQIESWPGLGTAVRLRMPLTLAIIPALILRSSGQSFALPRNKVSELVYLSAEEIPGEIQTLGSARLYRLRDHLLPVIGLSDVLALAPEPASSSGVYLAIIDTDGYRYALLLDELLSPEEIVVKPISSALRESGAFLAATVLGSGQLALILDAVGLGARAGIRPAGHARSLEPEPAQSLCVEREQERFVVYEIDRPGPLGTVPERFAIPLAAVERIEVLDPGALQSAGGRLLLHYGNELLPLQAQESDASFLDLPVHPGALRPNARGLTTLICHAPHRFAILVDRVVDICCIASAATLSGDAVMSVHGTATVVRRLSTAAPEFEEVA